MIQADTQGNKCEVAIVGAGPYGLSIASFLAARGVRFRVFGQPMIAWSHQMPKGMRLKSEGFASSLADPKDEFTLAEYCKQEGVPYQDMHRPVPLETFVNYGLAFQKKFVPNLETTLVESIRPVTGGFELRLADGELVFARKVIMAVGITKFAHLPSVFSGITTDLVSHSSAHSDLERFKGREVAVVGAGASALDLAALLRQAGASVQVIARSSAVHFHNPPGPPSLRDRLFHPATGIGTGIDKCFYVTVPHIFRWLPEKLRLDRMHKTLGPAPGWFVRDEVVGKVPIHLNTNVTRAWVENDQVNLELTDGNQSQVLRFEHVIAATGYQVDVERLSILSPELRRNIRLTEKSPLLSAHFESSVKGLYFVGVAAANTFGPVMRFAFGARYTARRLSKHLVTALSRSTVVDEKSSDMRVADQTTA